MAPSGCLISQVLMDVHSSTRSASILVVIDFTRGVVELVVAFILRESCLRVLIFRLSFLDAVSQRGAIIVRVLLRLHVAVLQMSCH